MKKIATPQDLQAELHSVMAFIHASTRPDRRVLASKLYDLANRVAGVPIPKGDPRQLNEDYFVARPFHEYGGSGESWNVSDDAGHQWVARKQRGKWEYTKSAGKMMSPSEISEYVERKGEDTKDFWDEAAGGDQVPMSKKDVDRILRDL